MRGIYRIKNNLTGKVYIGNTNSYEEIKILKAGLHDNEMLQSDFITFKENNFIVETVIEDIPEHEDINKITEEVILHENPYYNKFSIKEKSDKEKLCEIFNPVVMEGLWGEKVYIPKENSIFVNQVIGQIKEIIKKSKVKPSKMKGITAPKMSKIMKGTQSITLEDIETIASNCKKKPKLIFE
jgi:hypothetical protein